MKYDYNICVFTSDRDLGDKKPYAGIQTGQWITFEPGIEVYYASPALLTWSNIRKQLMLRNPDFIYLNSMFSKHFTLYPLLISRARTATKIILAPRGMLRSSAVQFKKTKKKLFLKAFAWSGLNRHIKFHATDKMESTDVKKFFGENATIMEAGNFPGFVETYNSYLEKKPGILRVVFIGRIHPIKNLHFLLELLPEIHGEILLTVIGGEEDKNYASMCREIATRMPDRIRIDFVGEVENKNVQGFLYAHHIFALPTSGENFGHAIFEALASGKPVLISDQTPWRNLQDVKAGWDLPLSSPHLFVDALQQAADFDNADYSEWSKQAWSFVNAYVKKNNLKEAYSRLFN
ncbi:MAG TPA: glycosyltransferase family 4 protein [Flavitalea sp.]|nr:glycosyltransferase family 4 protein [Flavitalea sp.]